jgi:outer membrane lipopolysaccharide assembly protein LptE/RlpB
MMISRNPFKTNPSPCKTAALLVMLILTLASCGFHLKTPESIPEPLHDLRIVFSKTPNDRFLRILSTQWSEIISPSVIPDTEKAAKKSKKTAPFTLEIHTVTLTKSIQSTSSSQLIAQYRLTLETTYRLVRPNQKDCIPLQGITTETHYQYNPNQRLGSNEEEKQAILTLYEQTAAQMIEHTLKAGVQCS